MIKQLNECPCNKKSIDGVGPCQQQKVNEKWQQISGVQKKKKNPCSISPY